MRRSKIIILVLVVATTVSVSVEGHAQPAETRTAAGVHYTAFRLDPFDRMRSGLGGWLSIDLRRWVGLDAGLAVWPGKDDLAGRQWQGLAGARAGWRNQQIGVFGKVRAGVMHFTERFLAPGVICILIFPPPEGCLIDRTNLALDLGGVLEVYPTPSVVVRVDGGDTMIRFDRRGPAAEWTHNVQFSLGAGWRF